ncbi:peptidyl-prolyl cis-trans isomerase D [Mucilaginibacter lappiensis]|uniref:Periplasmic chaperone PpiD n=1 Tax=Mucilaginibacter lappiensis TaxID=354630 RepID=A0ABR6PNJ0_9SPHI|nr:peptidylprolyl isomerase [Mucilaginibacter lappiensis]MBB6111342.1 peptidyl-prolyl cis-trans isomerase D [Mucilaginibacter lappiensis]SIR75844.1 peptidyl-prolyl cis-trans isomerase D [Mucilaginibacter lappiensis]
MGIMGYLRDRMGKIVAILIGLALLAFIVGEVVKSGGSFLRDDNNELAVVNGEKVPYDEFQKKLDQNSAQFKQSGQAISPQITSYIQETTWNQVVSQLLMNKEIEKLGIVVGSDESTSMVNGNSPDPQIARQFSDPQTGQFDRNKLNQFLSYLQSAKADPNQKQAWTDFLTQLIEAKKATKYMALVTNGLYVNSLDAKDDYEAKNKLVNFKYATLDYASIPDAKVTLSDEDYSTYYNAHKGEFKNPQDVRSFEYVSFNAAPSKEDSVAIKAQIDKLAEAFKTSTNDSLFVQINSETKTPISFQKKGGLEPKLDTVMFNAAKGFVYGPYISNGSYKLAKLTDEKTTFDSVRTRHILINPATEGGVEKAIAKADSIKKLIQGGKSFADLAATFSVDKGSGSKGGEIPAFDVNGAMGGGQGQITPEYTNAAFKAGKGDLIVVTSQFGVHLIQIEDQKGSVKVVKVAVVDKPIAASSKTQTVAYSHAQQFLGNLTKDNFEAEVKKEGLKKSVAEDFTGVAASLPGLDNARDIVRWAYKAEKGDITDKVFTVGDQYIVTRLTEIKPKGILSLDAVKKQIEPAVRNEVKAKQLDEKLSGGSSIDQVAQKAGVKVIPVQNIVFANPIIPGASLEYKVIGSVFGSQPNKLSKPVNGQQGVYVYVVDGFTNPPALSNNVREKQQIAQALMQRAAGQVLDALKDNAIVKDNRAKLL